MLQLAEVCRSGAVLQRDMPLRIFGQAEKAVKVTFDGVTVAAECVDGKFCAVFEPHGAGTGYTICVTDGDETVTAEDISVGEVLIAAGQSNMEMPLAVTDGAEDELEHCENENISFYSIPQQFVKGEYADTFRFQYMDCSAPTWKKCTADTAKDFSAVGYYVAKKLQKTLGVPVGVIGFNWGSRKIQSFIPTWAFDRHPALVEIQKQYEAECAEHPAEYFKEGYEKFKKHLACHKEMCPYPADLAYGNANFASLRGHVDWSISLRKNEARTPKGPYNPDRPGCMYHNMLEDVTPYSVRLVLWYQGGDDASGHYIDKFGVLMESWRESFKNPELPFYTMETSPFGRTHGRMAWRIRPPVRLEQREATLRFSNNYLITTAGLGDIQNVHPIHKRELAYRTARSVLHNTYGIGPKAENPYAVSAAFEGREVRVRFANNEDMIILGGGVSDLYLSEDGENFVLAKARIENDDLIAWAEDMENPCEIRYCYSDYYAGQNIFNSAALPASPFRFVKK